MVIDAVTIILVPLVDTPHWVVAVAVTRFYGWFRGIMRRGGLLDG